MWPFDPVSERATDSRGTGSPGAHNDDASAAHHDDRAPYSTDDCSANHSPASTANHCGGAQLFSH